MFGLDESFVLEQLRFVFLPETVKLCFVVTEFFLTVCTGDRSTRLLLYSPFTKIRGVNIIGKSQL